LALLVTQVAHWAWQGVQVVAPVARKLAGMQTQALLITTNPGRQLLQLLALVEQDRQPTPQLPQVLAPL
jgi:hypothetical protein